MQASNALYTGHVNTALDPCNLLPGETGRSAEKPQYKSLVTLRDLCNFLSLRLKEVNEACIVHGPCKLIRVNL